MTSSAEQTTPAPDLTAYRSILIFGGSFDPPHLAHTKLPPIAAAKIGADVVAYLPAGRAPHKLDQQQTPAHHRLAMLERALADQSDCIILPDELERPAEHPSYTVDTLEALKRRVGKDCTLRLLIGADQLQIFDSWREPERVIALAEPVVMVRPPETRQSLLSSLPDDTARAQWKPRLVDVPAMPISSTEIRQRVAAGRSLAGLVSEGVATYIDKHGLYR